MTKLPLEAEPTAVRIVQSPGEVTAVRVKEERRWGATIARLAVGALLMIVGITLTLDLYDQRPVTYTIAHALDAAKAAQLPLTAAELHSMTGWQSVPTYPPPASGQASNRIAADAVLVTADAAAMQDDTAFEVGALGIAFVGLTLTVSVLPRP